MKIATESLRIRTIIIWFVFLTIQILPQSVIEYEGTDSIFINPERGFSSLRTNPISQTLINSLKAGNVSVIQRMYYLTQYNKTPLPSTFLNIVENDLNAAREGGVKLVLRFAYTNNQNGADAALDTILLHISQLTPLLQNNYDVIAYFEAGFIGAWGEWYYSSHGLNNTTSRRTVLNALLNAVPSKRNVVIRTAEYKRNIFQITEPLDFEQAFSETFQARTGAHNDCFLASSTDFGTYGNVEQDKTFLNLDNRFVPQGGETCCDCGYAGCSNALKDLERMHWSVINKDYHPDVLNRWVTEGCMDEIKRRLGYRFELLNAVISDSIKPSGTFNLELNIENQGFASPYNPRNLEIILKSKTNNTKYRLVSDEDPRLWLSGDTAKVNISAGIPADISDGEYKVYVFLADPEPRLHDNPDYAIRLANKDLWEDSTGYNSLNHEILISSSVSGENYTGNKYFELYSGISGINDDSPVTPSEYKIEAYPNPFNGTAVITFNINPDMITDARVYDILGRSVRQFEYNEYKNNKIFWNASVQNSELSSGVYFITITTKENIYSGKIIFLK